MSVSPFPPSDSPLPCRFFETFSYLPPLTNDQVRVATRWTSHTVAPAGAGAAAGAARRHSTTAPDAPGHPAPPALPAHCRLLARWTTSSSMAGPPASSLPPATAPVSVHCRLALAVRRARLPARLPASLPARQPAALPRTAAAHPTAPATHIPHLTTTLNP